MVLIPDHTTRQSIHSFYFKKRNKKIAQLIATMIEIENNKKEKRLTCPRTKKNDYIYIYL